jgi:hypothetical protein
MDLLISANTVAKARADTAPASGTPGWATDGDPAAGIPATDAPAWHYNMMMAELLAIVDAAGIARSNTDWSQVLTALKTIFSPAQYGVAPYSAALATLIGGYPAGAIVYVSGAFWVSTVAGNMTVPGASGAKWKSLFDGYGTQAWAIGQFVQMAPADANNAGAAYLGVQTTLGYAWLNYKNSSGNLVAVVLADRAWVNSSFATLSGLSGEAAARSSADTTLAQAITNETTRAEEAEAQKANLAGGNSWSGTQNFGDDVVIAAGYKVFIEASGGAGSCYTWPEYYTSGNLVGLNAVTHVLDSSGNSLAWLALNGGNGRLYTSTGSVAFLADMPKAAIINSSNPNATGVSGSLSFTAARAGFLKLDVSSSNSGAHKVSSSSVSGTGYTSISGGYNAPEDMLAGSYIVAFAAGAAVTINVAVTYDGTSSTNYLNATGVIVYNA